MIAHMKYSVRARMILQSYGFDRPFLRTSQLNITYDVDSSPFLSLVVQHIKKDKDIILFNSKTVQSSFGRADLKVTNQRARNWLELVQQVNKISGLSQAVHMHNGIMIGDLFLMIMKGAHRLPNSTRKTQFTSAMALLPRPIVITNGVDENWGFFSSRIGTRTTKWINMTNHLRIHQANYETVRWFLDSPKLVLITSNTHVDPAIGYHHKLLCLPLGVNGRKSLFRAIDDFTHGLTVKKKRVLLINNSGWGDRAKINEQVSQRFNGTVRNTYDKKVFSEIIDPDMKAAAVRDHYLAIAESKFVLCPSGLGFDTYRLWETLLLGSIPIVESNTGFDRTYSHLPVLVVKDYADVTPELLDRIYPCFVRNAEKFRFQHLTAAYWMDAVRLAIRNASISHITEQHPPVNPICSVL